MSLPRVTIQTLQALGLGAPPLVNLRVVVLASRCGRSPSYVRRLLKGHGYVLGGRRATSDPVTAATLRAQREEAAARHSARVRPLIRQTPLSDAEIGAILTTFDYGAGADLVTVSTRLHKLGLSPRDVEIVSGMSRARLLVRMAMTPKNAAWVDAADAGVESPSG